MLPPTFFKTPDQNLFFGFQVKDFIVKTILLQDLQRFKDVIKKTAAANVNHQCYPINPAVRLCTEFGKFWDKNRRKVVHAKITKIFKTTNRLGLSGAGQAGNNDKANILSHRNPSFPSWV